MKKLILKGCGTALATPFRNGKVDYEAYRKLVTLQVGAGIDFLVPLGSTAETPCLEDEEKVELLKIAREIGSSIPIVAGCGTNSPVSTIKNMEMLESCNPDAYLVVVPYYNKPTQEGIYRYFKTVAEAAGRGIVIYNVPGRTGANIEPETVLRLAEIDNIIAIKEASGNVAQIFEILAKRPKGFSVLSGNDDQTMILMAGGADGVVSVTSNLVPEMMVDMVNAMTSCDYLKGRELNFKLMPLFDACFAESNPIPVKAGLHHLGICTKEMRAPLTEAAGSTEKLIGEVMDSLKA